MHICRSIEKIRHLRKTIKNKVHFVPTMGNLHLGHKSLLEKAKGKDNTVIASIFINPSQFTPDEDFNNYPRTYQKDLYLLNQVGIDALFYPDVSEIYPGKNTLGIKDLNIKVSPQINPNQLNEHTTRPEFFTGVCTVVSKLLNIIQPNVLHLGQKDGLQCIYLQQMINDLNFPVEVQIHPTIRHSDGLALSSRNINLSDLDRQKAPFLYKSLKLIESNFKLGITNVNKLRKIGQQYLISKNCHLEYLSFCDFKTGQELLNKCTSETMVSGAIKFNNCRIIDNKILMYKNESTK